MDTDCNKFPRDRWVQDTDTESIHAVRSWDVAQWLDALSKQQSVSDASASSSSATSSEEKQTELPRPPLPLHVWRQVYSYFKFDDFCDMIFCCGGRNAENGILETAEMFDTWYGRWVRLPNMHQKRAGCAAVACCFSSKKVGDKESRRQILVTAGYNDEGIVAGLQSSCEAYCPLSNCWEYKGALNRARWGHGSCAVAGKVYVIGGCSLHPRAPADEIFMETLKSCEMYDPATDKWTDYPSLITGRAGGRVTTLEDRFIVMVGGCDDVFGRADMLTNIEIIDTQEEQPKWEYLDVTLRIPRTTAAVAAIDSRIIVMGGAPCLDSVEIVHDLEQECQSALNLDENFTPVGTPIDEAPSDRSSVPFLAGKDSSQVKSPGLTDALAMNVAGASSQNDYSLAAIGIDLKENSSTAFDLRSQLRNTPSPSRRRSSQMKEMEPGPFAEISAERPADSMSRHSSPNNGRPPTTSQHARVHSSNGSPWTPRGASWLEAPCVRGTPIANDERDSVSSQIGSPRRNSVPRNWTGYVELRDAPQEEELVPAPRRSTRLVESKTEQGPDMIRGRMGSRAVIIDVPKKGSDWPAKEGQRVKCVCVVGGEDGEPTEDCPAPTQYTGVECLDLGYYNEKCPKRRKTSMDNEKGRGRKYELRWDTAKKFPDMLHPRTAMALCVGPGLAGSVSWTAQANKAQEMTAAVPHRVNREERPQAIGNLEIPPVFGFPTVNDEQLQGNLQMLMGGDALMTNIFTDPNRELLDLFGAIPNDFRNRRENQATVEQFASTSALVNQARIHCQGRQPTSGLAPPSGESDSDDFAGQDGRSSIGEESDQNESDEGSLLNDPLAKH